SGNYWVLTAFNSWRRLPVRPIGRQMRFTTHQCCKGCTCPLHWEVSALIPAANVKTEADILIYLSVNITPEIILIVVSCAISVITILGKGAKRNSILQTFTPS